MIDILPPDENPMVYRHSSIDQFKGFLSYWKKGGWAPIVFDQLDGIDCAGVHSHPVAISFGDDLGYLYPEKSCSYASDHFIYLDDHGVKQALLPTCMGGGGEFYEYFVDKNAFLSFDSGNSLGVHNTQKLRVGLSYVKADQTLPAVD